MRPCPRGQDGDMPLRKIGVEEELMLVDPDTHEEM